MNFDRLRTHQGAAITLNEVQMAAKDELEKAIKNGVIQIERRNNCLCQGSAFEILSTVDRFGLDFSAQICKNCGLVSTDPYIAESSLYKYYNEYYHRLHFGTKKEKEVLVREDQGHKIFQFVRPYISKSSLKVFEIGAGSGTNLLQIISKARNHGIQVQASGLEYNVKYAKFAAERGLTMFSQTLDEFCASNSECFDLIVLSHVLEHFVDPVSMARKLHSLAHENTLFYIEVPGLLDLKRRFVYDCDFLQYVTHAHVFHFCLGTVAWVMASAGFELLSGNEKVESLFISCEKPRDIRGNENYHKTLAYLSELEKNLYIYQRDNPERKLLRRLSRLPRRGFQKMWKLIKSQGETI